LQKDVVFFEAWMDWRTIPYSWTWTNITTAINQSINQRYFLTSPEQQTATSRTTEGRKS